VSTMDVSVGLNELSDVQFKVQQNPVGEKIVLLCNEEIGIVSATIMDALGRVLFDGKVLDNTIDVSSISLGLYSLRVNYSNNRNSEIKSSVIQFVKN
ncbi:MAG TPA: T9SS type A sorting domain-containing protein, partial [Bacteroidia bacterium]|nr:T9SS type A sorting domain-containing protein [Bacteroidia bacterium]